MVSSASPSLPQPPSLTWCRHEAAETEKLSWPVAAAGKISFFGKYFWEELLCLSIIYHSSEEDEMLEDNDRVGDIINC